jgi:hypothetical protein
VFAHSIVLHWSEEESAWVARVDTLETRAMGATPESALRAVLKAVGVKAESAAATLGRAGGLKGGKARAAKMTKARRAEIAAKAAAARWGKES